MRIALIGSLLIGLLLLNGCAVISVAGAAASVAGAAAGAAIGITGAAVGATVSLTGKVVGKTVDAVTPSKPDSDK